MYGQQDVLLFDLDSDYVLRTFETRLTKYAVCHVSSTFEPAHRDDGSVHTGGWCVRACVQ